MDLTGAPTEYVRLGDIVQKSSDGKFDKNGLKQLWKMLVEADQHEYVLNASSKGAGETVTDNGIIEGHA